MPYHIESSTGEYKIVDDTGKVHGTHPTRKQAVAQLQALYANVPDASGKDIQPGNDDQRKAVMAKIGGGSSGGHGAGWYHEDMSDSALGHVLTDNNFQEGEVSAHHATFGKRISKLNLKPVKVEHESDGKKYTRYTYAKKDEGGTDETEKASKDPGDYLIVEDREMPTTWHLQVRTNGTPDHRLMGAAWAALHEGYRGNTYEGPGKGEALSKLKKLYESEKMDTPATKEAQEPAPQPSIIDRVIAMFTRDKEGRRNSTPDGDRLQQIHDLAVLNGASCPMVMKEADGKLRWVLLSSNAFMDSDKEIISRKALEDDVARTDKEQAPYGPLRWWHMGAPDPIGLHAGSGADIGDCDYRAMSGRVLIESGTFRNERIGEAIKERADTLAGSIGFFHPKDEPDTEGVYRNIVQFERSLLPRGKASNMLTALTVKGWEDMATSKEKQDALAALLGDQSLAESVIKQAEIVEKQADDKGLKYKEETAEKALSGTPTAVPATGASGINPIGLAKEDKAKQAEGEPGEEKTEPKKEAAREPDWEALMKGLGPHISKMIEEKMKANAKEASEKEAGLKATIDQIAADVKELKGDIPRGLQGGFRASLSDMTIVPNINTKAAPEVGTLDSVIDQLMGLKK